MIQQKILAYLARLWEEILKLFFPPSCLYCEEKLPFSRHLFCKGCSSYFELIYPKDYCPFCSGETDQGKACFKCVQNRFFKVKTGSALEPMEPVMIFLYHLKKSNMPFLIKTASAFMTIQYFSFSWEKPDYIVALRSSFLDFLKTGSDPAYHLAKELSSTLKIPLIRSLVFSKKQLLGKRVLFIDLTLEKMEKVKSYQKRLDLKRATLFSLVRTF